MVSYWSSSDRKSPQVSQTLFSILADLNNIVVWMVSNRGDCSMCIIYYRYHSDFHVP